MNILFGYDRELEHFVPTHEPLMVHEAWVEEEVLLPKFISMEFFIDNYYKLTFLQRYGIKWSYINSISRLIRLMRLSGSDLYNAVNILNTKKKSAFITSTKASLKKWLDSESEYDHPWSGKQCKILDDMFSKNFRSHFIAISSTLSPITSFT